MSWMRETGSRALITITIRHALDTHNTRTGKD